MADDNTNTVVAIFDDHQIANRVAQELANEGIPRENVHVTSNLRTAGAGSAGSFEDRLQHENEGGIRGFFRRLFSFGDSPDERNENSEYAGHYAEAVRRGSAVVAVEVDGHRDAAIDIMNRNGAIDIDDRVASYRALGYSEHNESALPYTNDEAVRERERLKEVPQGEQGTTIPVVEEELQLGKRVVRRGGVRIYSRVISQPVEETIQLREEKVTVERRPVNRVVGRDDAGQLRDQTIEVTETTEQPVVSKQARVREEVVVGKKSTERTETVRDTVRRTEVNVESLPADGGASARDYDENSPGYWYGYELAGNERFRGRDWASAESDIRADYESRHPGSRWEEVKAAVRRGWDSVTGRR